MLFPGERICKESATFFFFFFYQHPCGNMVTHPWGEFSGFLMKGNDQCIVEIGFSMGGETILMFCHLVDTRP